MLQFCRTKYSSDNFSFMIDFLFLYEHKVRELENCLYLASGLERRGYKTSICSMLSFKKMITKARIIVTPHLYDENQLNYYTMCLWPRHKMNVISMQYEQVLSEIDRKDNIHRPKGRAKLAYHVAWGQNEEFEYLDNGINPQNILRIGSISQDFNTCFYKGFMYSKDWISNRYNIPSTKKWCIFFSSFAYCGRSDEQLNSLADATTAFILRDITEKTKPIILQWIKKAFIENDDIIFIYRKHPAEVVDNVLIDLCHELPERFFLIDDYSIRQWISVCDYFYTWFSTSSIDTYFAGKVCNILRPYPLDHELELETMYSSKKITNYSEFIETLVDGRNNIILDNDSINLFFDNKVNSLVINDYLDSFERVYNEPIKNFVSSIKSYSLKTLIGLIVYSILCDFCKYFRLSRLCINRKGKLYRTLKYYEQEVYRESRSIKEIGSTVGRFINSIGVK